MEKGVTREAVILLRDSSAGRPFFRIFRPQQGLCGDYLRCMIAVISQDQGGPVKIHIQKPLFAWDCLEDRPALATTKQLPETFGRRCSCEASITP
jgi:hypothetical protein